MLHNTTAVKIIKSNPISAFGGANFVFDYLNKMNIDQICNDRLPPMVNQSKYSWKDIFYSLKTVYLCGGDYIEDLQAHLKPHFTNNPFVKLASPDTVLRRLSQLSEQTQSCKTKRGVVTHQYCTNSKLESLNIDILKKLGVFKSDKLTIDYDNTIIFNEKEDSKMTYKRNYGYQPGVCTINEENILYIENRNGNSDAKSFQLDTLKRVFDLLDSQKIKKVHNFRADAASYQYDVISFLQSKVDNFYIGCRNSYVEKYFSQVGQWEEMKCEDGTMEVGSIEITPFKRQSPSNKAQTYRLVVKRKPKKDRQIDLITQDIYDYRAIITNDFDLDTKGVAAFYNQRGNMERQFDILKNDFGWNNMPFSSLNKNLVFLYFTAICRNLYNKIIQHFSKTNRYLKPTYRMKKFIFRFIILPAKWIKQSRQLKLRIYSYNHYQT
ncbi:IS1380 family transposase [Antarcticibacterium flavum]|uniref:IS1380 family transposase n=1 Tax=Antarcticibacterium flavum TaxID=2058175 RepID=A0A5B7X2A9_9FLAO|nr:IS1380 family transposase [Antarcticibacterium flavum]